MVGAGAVARKWLAEQQGISIRGCMSAIGQIEIARDDWSQVGCNPFFAATAQGIAELEAYMDELRRAGDSVGARLHVEALGMPVGLGSPLFDKLDADIAYAMMGINAVKGVEIGAGFASVAQRGSEHGDELTPAGFVGNNAGGVLGGISSGQDLTVNVAIKPTSSIRTPRRSVDLSGQPATVETFGRHDPCVGIRATPIIEAMLALVLMDHVLLHRAQCGDVRVDMARLAASAD
jgi:chorismate synthase